MRFLYKIYSGYDEFRPSEIPARIKDDRYLDLGWPQYLDVVDEGEEVWVFFFGPQRHRFEPGIYAKGYVDRIDADARRVLIRIREFSSDAPLTDREESRRIRQIVSARGRQVFLLPSEWRTAPECTVDQRDSPSCLARRCSDCTTWNALPRIGPRSYSWPPRLTSGMADYVPAFWVIPRRCFLYHGGRRVAAGIQRTSDLFYRFKLGEEALVHPLALAMLHALALKGHSGFDAVVPIPLSPEKVAAKELDRAGALASELARLLGSRVRRALTLSRPAGKRKFQREVGGSVAAFESFYGDSLIARPVPDGPRVLLVDDVTTKGSTLTEAAQALLGTSSCEVVAATAGQMIVRAVVRNEGRLIA